MAAWIEQDAHHTQRLGGVSSQRAFYIHVNSIQNSMVSYICFIDMGKRTRVLPHVLARLELALGPYLTEDPTLEDLVQKELQARGPQPHISYFGFTGTPKNKTLELFGRKI